ncbi:hypothetical protein RHODO2019_15475 [Rhodococcus antarcticus]|uniref:RAMA domain-containing protein n=1 Tax=Rhodococcus antarcticus TaxID=2987751 RepID=A0ABY6NZ01_9NOCA|nr:hypothetical protein [Rhodococcus antarcticus]UZJ24513.1 hypothetical protein RHODO2019_15475 [Rhodococcus antarcticus]
MTGASNGHGMGATCFMPPDSAGAVLVEVPGANLDFAVVTRLSIHNLDIAWAAPGAYLLLDPTDSDGRTGVYVGKATGGLTTRVRQHIRGREQWQRAVLVRRPYQGFNSAEAGWLEGRLYDVLQAADLISLGNGNRPSDETLPQWHRTQLEAVIEPVLGLLRVLGLNPDSRARQATPSSPLHGRQPPVRPDGTLVELIAAGHLQVGAQLHPVSSSDGPHAEVRADGAVMMDCDVFASLSAAARAVVGHSVNGWTFWGVSTDSGSVTPLSVLRALLSNPRLDDAGAPRPDATPTALSPTTSVTPPAPRPVTTTPTTVSALLATGALSQGEVVVVRYKSTEYRATITQEGHLRLNGVDYPTPTAAAVSITSNNVNGWRFWRTPACQGELRPVARSKSAWAGRDSG